MTGEKKTVEENTPKSKPENNNSNGSPREEAAANTKGTPSGKRKSGAGVAIGFGAAGVAAGTVAAAGVAGYAVGASQPFHEFAEGVVSDLGYGHPKETIQPEVLQEPLEEPDPETAIHVDDKVYEDSAVAAETGDELDVVILNGELIENMEDSEEEIAEVEIPVEEVIVEDSSACEVEEELADPTCDTMGDAEMEPEDASVEDISTDPLASNFIDPNIPIDNNMDMSDFI